MGIIEATRILGAEIQKDERFIRFIKAKLANDNDETLQNQIGEFNTVRMNLDREMNAETQDEAKIKELTAAKSRCMPFESEHISDTCVCCGKPANKFVIWGRQY